MEAARTLAVQLEKQTSSQWDTNCSAFCSYLRRRRRNVTAVDHYALKYHYLRNTERRPPSIPVNVVLAYNARERARGRPNMMLPNSNVLIRHWLHTCECCGGLDGGPNC